MKVNILKNKKNKQFNDIKHSRKNTEMNILKVFSLSRQGGNMAAENV